MVALLAATALNGCAGNGNGLDANGNPITPGGGGTLPLTADFQSIQDNVFTPICTKCHIGAGAPEGLQLDADHSYTLLVGVSSVEQPGVLRVAPGDPDDSYIVRKLEDAAGISGEQMPLGGPYLPQSTIDVIRQWITAGAPKAMAASLGMSAKATKRFGVTVTSPDNDSIATMILPNIVVAFNADVDASLVNNTTIVLDRVDVMEPSQPTTPEQPHIPITTSIPVGNPSAVLITPRNLLTSGKYRVTLRGTGGGALADVNAQTLGADYSFTFTVDATP
jgi:hypothetical protein